MSNTCLAHTCPGGIWAEGHLVPEKRKILSSWKSPRRGPEGRYRNNSLRGTAPALPRCHQEGSCQTHTESRYSSHPSSCGVSADGPAGHDGGGGCRSVNIPRAGTGWGRHPNDRDRVRVPPLQAGKAREHRPMRREASELVGSPTEGTTGSEKGELCPMHSRKVRLTLSGQTGACRTGGPLKWQCGHLGGPGL